MSKVARRTTGRRTTAIVVATVGVAAAAIGGWLLLGGGAAPSEQISVYPPATTAAASRTTSITLRGEDIDVGGAVVQGLEGRRFRGTWDEQPDGGGWTFTPRTPFPAGDRVTVKAGGTTSSFRVAANDAEIELPPFNRAQEEGEQGIQHFTSRPDLRPPAVELANEATQTTGPAVFVAPKRGPTQQGPMILDRAGDLVWFQPVVGDESAFDFRAQRYNGEDVLTWWQGSVAIYRGAGSGRIVDDRYHEIARVRAVNGYKMDLHEFELTDRGTALLIAYTPVRWDLTEKGGREDGIVDDCVIQEIDVETGALLFEWHALGSIGLDESDRPLPAEGQFYDPIHFNSVALAPDGDFIVSARNTSAIYKVDRETGTIVWRLGGKKSDFEMGPGAAFSLQHHARVHPDGTLSLFDNVAEDLPAKGRESRGLVLDLDTRAMKATVVREYSHPGVLSPTQGSLQTLGPQEAFVGWGGGRREFTAYSAPGEIAWDAHFVTDAVETYRAYTMRWAGRPDGPPDGVLRNRRLSLSWNGSTGVTQWRITPAGGKTETIARKGFETRVRLPDRVDRVRVQALDHDDELLGEVEVRQIG